MISGLIDGNWTCERAGLLDDDHVRCFTRRELEKLLYRAGFEIHERRAIPGSGYEEWRRSDNPGTVQIGNLSIAGLNPLDAEEFFIYQHLARSQPFQRRNYGLTSIIIATFNQLWATRQCVDSILIRTDEDIELIFVDNGSADGTPEYLQSIPGAKVILNSDNRGFAPAVNQGLKVATGQQLLLLNNDCIVTTGWLDGLLEALHDDPANGLVGPVSNNVSGEQQIPVTYSDLTSLDGFAWDLRSHRQLTETDRLVGFCLLFRREVMDRIGLLDEQFEVGCFEDDDFCRRAQAVGFRSVIANHVFVHHFGSATFRGSGADFAGIMAKNEQRYRSKWNSSTAQIQQDDNNQKRRLNTTELADRYSVLQLDDGSQLLQRKQIHLSLCMIVRDNEDTIEACLDSIYPWVDEIIIVDTGSRDRTPEICRRYGARMFAFPWCDDFSAARNVSLAPARGEWIFWMDSDDVISQEQGQKLRELVYGQHADDCFGYVAQVHCESSEPGQMTVVDHVKIFRNLPGLQFEHRIHEQILPAIRRAGGTVAFTDLYVTHKGSIQTPEIRQRKIERDFRILALDLEGHPDHPFVLFNLGMTHEDVGNYAEAERLLRRCLEVSGDGESHVGKTYSLLVNSLKGQGQLESAIEAADEALAIFQDDKELLFRRSILHLELNRLEDAARDMEQVIQESIDRTFQSLDQGITGHKAFHNLGVIYEQQGRFRDAENCWQQAIQLCPAFSVSWLALARLYVKTGQIMAAEHLHVLMNNVCHDSSAQAIVHALILEQQGHTKAAGDVLQKAFESTGDNECLDEAARILLYGGQFLESQKVLEQLLQLNPDDPATHYNLAVVSDALGYQNDAIEYLRDSLRLRPASNTARSLLESIEARLA